MTITTVRPTSTDVVNGVGTTGAVAVHTAVSDTNNATRATGLNNFGYAWLGFPSTGATVSSSLRLKQARIGLVYAHDGIDVGHIEPMTYRLKSPTGLYGVDSTASTYSSTPPAATSPIYGPWNTSAPGGGPWTQAAIDACQVQLFWRASVNNQFLNVYEVYVQFDTNNQPTVTGVTVTGNTQSTRPTVTFGYNDVEADPQTEYRVKIFTAAQFGATGFDPEFSIAAWDSGTIQGAQNTQQVMTDLLNGTTYRAYVKAAQAWPGPEGQVWYSTWASSANFTITVSPPPTPTVTISQQLTEPHYRNLLTIGLAGLNVLTSDSAGFENGIGTWQADTNAVTPATSATNPKSGSSSLTVTSVAAGNVVVRSGDGSTGSRIRAGQTISATTSWRSAVSARTVSTGVRFYDASGVAIGADQYGTGVADNTSGYVTPTITAIVAPAGAYRFVVLGRVASTGGAAETHRMDEAGLIYGPSATWTPGGYLQSGAVQAQRALRVSKTIRRAPARNYVHPQLYSGGGLTHSTDGFIPRQSQDQAIWHLLDRSPPEAPGDVTAGMIEWLINVGPFSYIDVGFSNGVATDGTHPYLFPVVAGTTYFGTMWVWANASKTARLGMTYVDEFNTAIGSDFLSGTANLTGTEQRIVVTGAAPAGATFGRLYIEDTSGTNGFSMFMTQPRVRPSFEPDEVWPGQTFSWEFEDVRDNSVALPTDGSDTVTVYDHEAPPGRPVHYTARINATTSGGDSISSIRARYVSCYMTNPTYTILKDTSQPENAFQVRNRRPGDTENFTQDEDEIHAAGRDQDPVFGRSWTGNARNTITVDLTSELDLYRIQQISPTARAALIQWRTGGQSYVHITNYAITRVRESRLDGCKDTLAVVAISYAEQARPAP